MPTHDPKCECSTEDDEQWRECQCDLIAEVRKESHGDCICADMDAAVVTEIMGFNGVVQQQIIESVLIRGVEFVPATRGLDYWYARDYWQKRGESIGYAAALADAVDAVKALRSTAYDSRSPWQRAIEAIEALGGQP